MKYFLTVALSILCLNILPAQKHIIKVAPVKLFNSNIGFTYETVFKGRASFQLETQIKLGFTREYQDFIQQYSFLPRFEELNEVDDEVSGTITRVTSFRITPEYRLYLGKKGPKGFYLPFFLRYINESYSADISYLDDGVDRGGVGEAKFVTIGAGLGIGYQLVIKNRVTFDWTLGVGGGWTTASVATTLPNSNLDERVVWVNDIQSEVADYPLLPQTINIEATDTGISVDNLAFFRPIVRSVFSIGIILN